jgi:hypothetical protein
VSRAHRNSAIRTGCLLTAVFILCVTSGSSAQTLERTFHAPKADVEQVLRTLRAYAGGELPVLDGFVDAGVQTLDRYERPYYKYSLEVSSANPNESAVRVSVKITAWYADPNVSRAGYRILPSNGRLESDLLARLEEALRGKAPAQAANPKASPVAHDVPPTSALPDAASAAKSSEVFWASQNPSSSLSPEQASSYRKPVDSAAAKHVQQLEQEAKNLEDILHNQSKPDNLALVKDSRTPVVSHPGEGGKLLFLADAEDEFQFLEAQGDWVHVKMTDLARGWIRRSQLDLSAVSAQLIEPLNTLAAANDPAFQQTREETAVFPGAWEPLRGKKVKIIWVQPNEGRKDSGLDNRAQYVKSVFRKAIPGLSKQPQAVAGIVVVFDSADGGMAAATVSSLQRWKTGSLTDDLFWRQCWLDPPEAFKKSADR